MRWWQGVLGATTMLASLPAAAEERPTRDGAEVALGVFAHGANFHPLGSRLIFDPPKLPPGGVYEGEEEDGTVDVQAVCRTAPLHVALKPRMTAKAQVNTAGRTSFVSAGAEWRQHAFRRRVYGQVGIGVTLIDGYRFTPDPFAAGLPAAEVQRRYDLYRHRTSFGSQVLFNPNASFGLRLDRRWAAEIAWEHFSHRQIFNEQNPGIDNVGLRLVRSLGR